MQSTTDLPIESIQTHVAIRVSIGDSPTGHFLKKKVSYLLALANFPTEELSVFVWMGSYSFLDANFPPESFQSTIWSVQDYEFSELISSERADPN